MRLYRYAKGDRVRYLILASLAGCIDFYDLQDRATSTAEICGLDGGMVMRDEVLYDPNISDDCRKAILSDFRANGLTHSEQTLINGAYGLLAYDWQEFRDDSIPSLEDARFGDEPFGWVMYNWTAAQFKETVEYESSDSSAAYNPARDELRLDKYMTCLSAAQMLMHEAHHAAEGSRHITCDNGEENGCDDGDTGAYTVSVLVMESAPADSEGVWYVIDTLVESYKWRIQ